MIHRSSAASGCALAGGRCGDCRFRARGGQGEGGDCQWRQGGREAGACPGRRRDCPFPGRRRDWPCPGRRRDWPRCRPYSLSSEAGFWGGLTLRAPQKHGCRPLRYPRRQAGEKGMIESPPTHDGTVPDAILSVDFAGLDLRSCTEPDGCRHMVARTPPVAAHTAAPRPSRHYWGCTPAPAKIAAARRRGLR